MGYTHYFHANNKKLSISEWLPSNHVLWEEAYNDAIKIGKHCRSMLDQFEIHAPTGSILINGGCETLVIPKDVSQIKEFDFCKTKRLAYDKVVTAILAVMAETEFINIGSDGGREGFNEGVNLARLILRREVKNPIEPQD